ncbi:MAG TPA: glutamyl-tRNA reductase, partial [Actinomycetota bacterium]
RLMPILSLGVSYRRAPVELLERLAFADDDYSKAYRRLRDLGAVHEGVILSTCNRVEVFADVTSYHAGFLDLKRFLSEAREVPPEDFAEPLYSHYEDEAVQHLFAVAAGLDSMVVGEPQIFAQVRGAYRRAEAEQSAGPMLSALFRGAIRAGRRARSETAIGASPSAFVEVGAGLAQAEIGDLHGRSAVVVGAGAMATLAAKHLRDRGMRPITVVSRNTSKAEKLAEEIDGESVPLSEIASVLREAELVVSSTGASGTVIGVESVGAAGEGRSGRPLFVLDLAVPRDVEPEVGDLPGVRLADLDDLRGELAARNEGAGDQIAQARAIIEQETRRFATWRRAAKLAPLIQALKERGDEVRAAELAKVAPKLAGLSPKEREAVENLAEGIVAKLLHDPIVRVKERAGAGPGEGLAAALAELFGIDLP